MIYKKGQFQVKRENVDRAESIIADFISQVHTFEQDTKFYNAFQHEDGVTFTLFMSFSGADAESLHRNSAYAQVFMEKLYPLCEGEPVFTRLSPIGTVKGL